MRLFSTMPAAGGGCCCCAPLLSFTSSPHPGHARNLLVGIPNRVRPLAAASRRVPSPPFAARRSLHYSTVHGFARTILANPTAINAVNLPTMNHPYFTRSKILLSRRNHEGYIPRTCSTPSIWPSPSTSPSSICSSSALPVSSHLISSDAPQCSDEWFSLRKDKLTTSTFSTVLGFWKGNRRSELWHEKVFGPAADSLDASAKAAMGWGVNQESNAIEKYKSITGRDVSFLGFAVHAEAKFGWLGASPDGLLGCCLDGGILEVKCPYNKGKPELALPWQAVPYYYMPQVQGQMEIMDRDWVDLYCWTPNGSALFRVVRDREYWDLIYGILKEFWWGNVVPAREAVLVGNESEARTYHPEPKHELTGVVIGRSQKLAGEARMLCRDIGGHVEFFR